MPLPASESQPTPEKLNATEAMSSTAQPPMMILIHRQPRGPMYATLAVIVLALAGMISLRFAPIRFVGTSCDPRIQVCR